MKITLSELIQYYDQETEDRIQVVIGNSDWDEWYEMPVHSELLSTLGNWTITDMRIERSYTGDPVIRVALEKGDRNDRLETETDKQEVVGGDMCAGDEPGDRVWWLPGGGCADYCDHYGRSCGDRLHHRRRAC